MYKFTVSQQINEVPYSFKSTGIRVFSFEEALYHVYHYWKQSADDFLSVDFISWVNDTLRLSYLAARIKELKRVDSFNQRMLGFLRLSGYFNDAELKSITQELKQWEMRLEWEKLKERADYLINRGEPDKAIPLYRHALQYEENAVILNNLGVGLIQLGEYNYALNYFTRALKLDRSFKIMLHYAEAAAHCKAFDQAEQALAVAAKATGYEADISYIKGIIASERRLWNEAIGHFENAIEQTKRTEMKSAGEAEPTDGQVSLYVFKLADVYMHMRQYEKAFSALECAEKKDVGWFVKQAELNATAGNVSAAVKSIQKALTLKENDAALWTKMALYRRMDYDFNMADAAISKALSIAPDNERARLESARIKKALGRTREYQAILNQVLKGFRQRYREV